MIGDGNPDCDKCLGRGVIDIEIESGPPEVRPCKCVMIRDVLRNTDRGWKGLTKAGKVKSSPLMGLTETSVWVTATRPVFRAHVRHVAVRQGPVWNFQTVSDMDLMTAWLGSIALKRQDIYDADVALEAATESLRYHALVDIASPPGLLIIQLGVKAARNAAMPEVLEEAILVRVYDGKPTWVFDQPEYPFGVNHLCYSDTVREVLDDFERIRLDGAEHQPERKARPKPKNGGSLSLSGAMGSHIGGTQEFKKKRTYTKKKDKGGKR